MLSSVDGLTGGSALAPGPAAAAGVGALRPGGGAAPGCGPTATTGSGLGATGTGATERSGSAVATLPSVGTEGLADLTTGTGREIGAEISGGVMSFSSTISHRQCTSAGRRQVRLKSST